MRYTYKVRELGKDIVDSKTNEVGKEVGNAEEMQELRNAKDIPDTMQWLGNDREI